MLAQEIQRRQEEEQRKRMSEREAKMYKKIQEEDQRNQLKTEREEARRKMKEDILSKKKQILKNGDSGIKVEIVGIPEGMMTAGEMSSSQIEQDVQPVQIPSKKAAKKKQDEISIFISEKDKDRIERRERQLQD